MTVSELIKELQTYDPNMEVMRQQRLKGWLTPVESAEMTAVQWSQHQKVYMTKDVEDCDYNHVRPVIALL